MVERLTWLGHSTVLVEAGGARLLTDPVLRLHVVHLRRHAPVPPVPDRLDAVLISHLHHDHLDVPTLLAIDPATPLVVPRGARPPRGLRALDRDVREVEAGDTLQFGGVRVRAVPAVHDGRRAVFGAPTPALGFEVEGRRRVYFAGDTELFAGMANLAGDVAVALLPVWGWGLRLGPGHMDPDEAACAAALVDPEIAVPIHWGTYLPRWTRRRHHGLLRTPGREFADRVAERAPGVRSVVLAPGASLVFDGAAGPA
jgi:L-ascorbate metabolism protein UlaG (beta-lactamase superfamily)